MHNLNLDRLDHLVLTVRDVNQTCAFYQRVLGMEIETFGQNSIEVSTYPALRP